VITATGTDIKQSELTPYVGYMVSSRIAVGILGGYTRNEQVFSSVVPSPFSTINILQESFSAGPFVRYYHPITEKFFVFAQGDLTYGKGESTQTVADPTIQPAKAQITSTTIALRPGVSYFITKRWAVEVILGSVSYANRDFKAGSTSKDMNGYSFNFITRGVSPGILFTF